MVVFIATSLMFWAFMIFERPLVSFISSFATCFGTCCCKLVHRVRDKPYEIPPPEPADFKEEDDLYFQ